MARSPNGVGNTYGLVGRFLMDHPRCALGYFNPKDAIRLRERCGLFTLNEGGAHYYFLPGLTFSETFQRANGLMNCAAWIGEERAADDPWEAVKRLATRSERQALRDLTAIASHPYLVLQGIADRLVRGRGVRHKLKRLSLDCIVEQVPDPESRLYLGSDLDRLGVPIPILDWKVSRQEKQTALALGRVIDEEFKRVGLPHPEPGRWTADLDMDDTSFIDAAHPCGTTRMSSNAHSGVVDENCRIHGTDSIFVAGSSVFPTSGRANPTLMIVILAVRLADWLKQKYFTLPNSLEFPNT